MQSADFLVKDDDAQFEQKYPSGLALSDLVPFYHAVARNDPIKLEWVCHGKLSSGKGAVCERTTSPALTNPATVSQSKPANPESASKLAEFDFDEANQSEPAAAAGMQLEASNKTNFPANAGPLPLRRVGGPNRSAPKQPRVANMDKILNDFFRARKETTAPPSQAASGVISSTPRVSESVTSVSSASMVSGGDGVPAANTNPLSTEASVTNEADTPVVATVTGSNVAADVTTLPMDHLTVTDSLAGKDGVGVATTTGLIADSALVTMAADGSAAVTLEAVPACSNVLSPPSAAETQLMTQINSAVEGDSAGDSSASTKSHVLADHITASVDNDSEMTSQVDIPALPPSPPVVNEVVPGQEC